MKHLMGGRTIRMHIAEIKIASDFVTIARFIKSAVMRNVNGFTKAFLIMITVFGIRASMGGYAIPQAIANIVNAVRNGISDALFINRFLTGILILLASAVIFFATEFALLKYFTKLVDAIVILKNVMLKRIEKRGNSGSPEDIVGRISSDVDFIIWNINAVLTTLIPNLFNGVASIASVFSFNAVIGYAALASLIPYAMIAEYYSRRVEPVRTEERRAYSSSIVHVRNAVYEYRDFDILSSVFSWWRKATIALMWYDRVFWGCALLTQFTSVSAIAYISVNKARTGEIDVGALAGILTAVSGAHGAIMNAMWALCIQSQTVAAIKRVSEHFFTGKDDKRGEAPLQIPHRVKS
jgi:ABC-type multidrug transport system fused ATPase/permease subunit